MKLSQAIVLVICLLASPAVHAADIRLSGSAFYRERIALPPDAALHVEFIDLAEPKAVLGSVTVAPSGQVPIAFDVIVGANKLSKGKAYAMRAHIEVGGTAWFSTPEPIPVDPGKIGEPVSLFLVQAADKGAGVAATISLAGTEWRVTTLGGKSLDSTVKSTLSFGANGTVNGNGGCNTFRGDVEIEGSAMKFGHLASTMMACIGAASTQEALFHEALSQTVSFSIQDGELRLLDQTGNILARLREP